MAPERTLRGVDTTTPNAARIYDYWLGGKDNFAVDREIADKLNEETPGLPTVARAARAFLERTVRFLAEAGIRQFLDLGSGLPSRPNVHEVAQAVSPDARVVYVDNDPVVVSHAEALLSGKGPTCVIGGDLYDLDDILTNAEFRKLIDLEQPVAFLLLSVLHLCADDEKVARVCARVRELMRPGSYLAISHAVSDVHPEKTKKTSAIYREASGTVDGSRRQLRTMAEVGPFFGDLELVDPGLVYVDKWRPDHFVTGDTQRIFAVGGVAFKA